MRDFFKHELSRLHLTTGLQQAAKLSDAEITELLDLLCAKCAQFHLIPDEVKQKYIRECMETDSEFLGFNAKILHKWLNILNRGYIHTQAEHQEIPRVELTKEQQAEVDKMLSDYMKQLQPMATAPSYGDLEAEKKAIIREDKEAREGRKAIKGKVWTIEDQVKMELHNRWIRENFDPRTGYKLEGWLSEEEWLRKVEAEEMLTPAPSSVEEQSQVKKP